MCQYSNHLSSPVSFESLYGGWLLLILICGAVMIEKIENRTVHRINNFLFKDEDIVAKGRLSRVFRGVEEHTQRSVAIKQIKNAEITSKIARRLLECEIISLRLVNHPNVIRCLDIHPSENHCYIVTEFCEGGDLASLIKTNGPLSEGAIAPLLLDILLGLEYLFSLSIIHRDLKLQNIFLHKGRAVIGDLGFSIIRTTLFKDTFLGTPFAMSPEALFYTLYGPKSDVWSFGILIYELLNGTAPLANCATEEELKIKLLQPLTFPFTISQKLQTIIKMCTVLDEHHRASIEDISNTQYFRNLKALRQRGALRYFVPQQTKLTVSEISTSPSTHKPSDTHVSTTTIHHKLHHNHIPKTVCIVFGQISKKVALALMRYCQLVYRVCSVWRSTVLVRWLKTVSLALVGVPFTHYKQQKVKEIIQEDHLKYMELFKDVSFVPVVFEDVFEECRKEGNTLKYHLLPFLRETEHFMTLYEDHSLERYASESNSSDILVHYGHG